MVCVDVVGVGIVGPGFVDWPQAQAALVSAEPLGVSPTLVPAPQRLPATERRRAGTIIKISIHVADEALAHSGLQASQVATVFSASEGDGKNCHDLCVALAAPVADRMVSPTRFTNSVHNASAGYWHIAAQSMTASTSLCALDGSFAMGLMEAATQCVADDRPVMLVVVDQPYPEPLHATRPLMDAMGMAIVLAPRTMASAQRIATLHLGYAARAGAAADTASEPTSCQNASLEALRLALPSARGLPLLEALATPSTARSVLLACFDDFNVHVRVA